MHEYKSALMQRESHIEALSSSVITRQGSEIRYQNERPVHMFTHLFDSWKRLLLVIGSQDDPSRETHGIHIKTGTSKMVENNPFIDFIS